MMIRMATLRAIADGIVTQAFRRWEVPRVRPGGRQRTALGVLAFDSVDRVDRATLTDADAKAAGFSALDELLAMLDRREAGDIYRIRLRLVGPDPRVALRASVPDAAELDEVRRRLERLDRASQHGPWTVAVLAAIGNHEGMRAAELAASFGREKLPFKLDVRKLKELGLTESLRPGYRLSPRGRAVLRALAPAPEVDDPRITQ
jgi:hypothetical protein